MQAKASHVILRNSPVYHPAGVMIQADVSRRGMGSEVQNAFYRTSLLLARRLLVSILKERMVCLYRMKC
ncbi:hypothetical protein GGI1_19469 [Acidithiobacillus sp. GGI-221]|nr:hypothetical protein GGI1_19469 [Acidithiobacillus sp. GGI-221]